MIAEIIKIIPFKKSRNPGDFYLHLEFKLENNEWAKTDLVPGFRNYYRWKRVARVGNQLGNLIFKDSQTIDADSYPILIRGRRVIKSDLTIEKLAKLGVFG